MLYAVYLLRHSFIDYEPAYLVTVDSFLADIMLYKYYMEKQTFRVKGSVCIHTNANIQKVCLITLDCDHSEVPKRHIFAKNEATLSAKVKLCLKRKAWLCR